jgi:hypothetical protein
MIDFVQLKYTHPNINAFLNAIQCDYKGEINMITGETSYPYTFELIGYKVRIEQSKYEGHHIIINGSLHKNFYNGYNWQRFTYANLQTQIIQLCNALHIGPELLEIQILEVGVNVQTVFPPFNFLQNNLLLYRTKIFKQYKKGKDGKELGFYCEGLPEVKIYDKGKQNNLPFNLMRFELKYKKSSAIKKGAIKYLSDLQMAKCFTI